MKSGPMDNFELNYTVNSIIENNKDLRDFSVAARYYEAANDIMKRKHKKTTLYINGRGIELLYNRLYKFKFKQYNHLGIASAVDMVAEIVAVSDNRDVLMLVDTPRNGSPFCAGCKIREQDIISVTPTKLQPKHRQVLEAIAGSMYQRMRSDIIENNKIDITRRGCQ